MNVSLSLRRICIFACFFVVILFCDCKRADIIPQTKIPAKFEDVVEIKDWLAFGPFEFEAATIDVQMLLAHNHKELENYTEAERHLKIAAAMCPSRFMPLYELTKLYKDTDRKEEALAMAKIIIEKDVKIPSRTVTAIKNEMLQFIEAQEASDAPENENRASEEPENNHTRQGEAPNGAALPP